MVSENLNVSYEYISASEVDDAYKIEIEGFPKSEAASIDTLRYRQKEAPELFLAVYLEGDEGQKSTLIGYVCGTALKSPTITHECMKYHDPSLDAKTVAIHSLVIKEQFRRQGIATGLLREYNLRLSKMREESSQTPRWDTSVLLAHDDKIKFYNAAGFYVVQKSDVVHGPREWYQLAADLGRNLLARPYRSFISSFSPPPPSSSSQNILADQDGKNKYGLVCPFRHCTSTILLPGKATLVSVSSEPLNHKDVKPTRRFPDFPPSDSDDNLPMMWSIPSPLTFENIGFSRDVGTIKYLSCADCECGPLGWHDTGGANLGKQVELESQGAVAPPRNQFLLSLERVRYIVKE